MATGKLKRDAGPLGLLFASIGGMIGSGWLFGALNAAKIAGPASVISWVIGGGAVLLLAFVYAELTTMFPRPGAVIVFPKLCHGMLAAQVMSWINFLAYVLVAPIEAVAVVSYGNNYIPGLLLPAFGPAGGTLTHTGLLAAAALMLLFIVVNLVAIRLVLAFNNAVTWWKLAVPAVTVVALLAVHFRAANFTQFGFAPAGTAGIFSAVSGAGIIFTYLGFRQAIELAGETENPKRALPFAILGSVLICMVLYAGLQIAFIGAISPADLAKGWSKLSFPGISGPFAGLATLLNLSWLAVLLYVDAAISPAGTGIIYNTTAARVIYATADEGLLHKTFATVTRAGVPLKSLMLSFAVGLIFLLFFAPNWQMLVSYLSPIGVLAYGVGPVALICFRKTLPEAEFPRPFRLPYATLLASLAFIVANLVVFWTGPIVVDRLMSLLLLVFVIFCIRQAFRGTLAGLNWRGGWWLAPYFSGLWLITFLGPVPQHLARLPFLGLPVMAPAHAGLLTNATGAVAIAAFSLAIIALARRCAIADPSEAKTGYG